MSDVVPSREPYGSGLELTTRTNAARRARSTRAGAAGGAKDPRENPLEPLQKTPTAFTLNRNGGV